MVEQRLIPETYQRGFTEPVHRSAEEFNDLPANVWPRNARREPDGTVSIAGVSLSQLAAEYGTPLYVVDEDDFRSRCRDMAAAFGADNVHYASKAFLTRRIATWVAEEGLHLDVASLGELEIALAAGFDPAHITAHGNNKTPAYIERIVTCGVGTLVLDAPDEIAMVAAAAAAAGRTQQVMVRVKPGISAHTHEMIATAHEDQKFGFSLASGSAFRACEQAVGFDHLDLVGLHCHVGSQVFDAEGFSQAAERILNLFVQVHAELGQTLDILDLGGGFGISYTARRQPLDISSVASDMRARVAHRCEKLGITPPRLMVEPGRAIVGPSTVTIYTVGQVKDVHVTDTQMRRYVAVDGGMSDNIRPALYQAVYDFRLVNRWAQAPSVPTRVVGSHCESGDILAENESYPADIAAGDLLATAATGAYCYSMSSRYNMMLRPAVVSVRDGAATLMVRRETIDDILALEP
ncbi:MAG: diaminopimelate decarboxylase [Corynebacterium sp.]|nr:diaminopimelate decarboxylase [Corynebacterium sp.]